MFSFDLRVFFYPGNLICENLRNLCHHRLHEHQSFLPGLSGGCHPDQNAVLFGIGGHCRILVIKDIDQLVRDRRLPDDAQRQFIRSLELDIDGYKNMVGKAPDVQSAALLK